LIKPLGLKIDKPAATGLEFWFTMIAVYGFFLYIINTSFKTVAMPSSYPQWLVRLASGYENTFPIIDKSVTAVSFWSVMPFIWIMAPICCFYYPVLKFGILNKGNAGSEKK
jgi:hypothetical protein